jgi:hypothetical protein
MDYETKLLKRTSKVAELLYEGEELKSYALTDIYLTNVRIMKLGISSSAFSTYKVTFSMPLAKIKTVSLVSKRMQWALAVETSAGKTEFLYGVTKKEWAHFEQELKEAKKSPLVLEDFVEIDAENQREVSKQNKAVEKVANVAVQEEKNREFIAKYGEIAVAATFGGCRVTIYRNGFIKSGNIIGMFAGQPEELLEISGDTDITKKSGAGRVLGAALTAGGSILASANQRGNIYLSFVTSNQVVSLNSGSGDDWDIMNMRKLVAAGKAAISKRESLQNKDSASTSNSNSNSNSDQGGAQGIEERLQKLADLREKGLLDEEEYKASKAKLLGL